MLQARHLVLDYHRWRFTCWTLGRLKITDVTKYHTDEEVERCFEEFYEDVHTEFLKFGEIVNFKVCRNSSMHLRGNLYVHYKSLDSAMLAYQSVNGRYFAGKQVTCEFVGVTKWRVAICGEFMRSRLKTCSRGTACNFIHCFRNPGGDYEWADWDKPPPRYWVQEMAALFGHSQQFEHDCQRNTEGRKSGEITTDTDRRPPRRSESRERGSSSDQSHEEYDSRRSRYHRRHLSHTRKAIEYTKSRNGVHDSDSDRDLSKEERGEDGYSSNARISNTVLHNHDYHESSTRRSDSNAYGSDIDRDKYRKRYGDPQRDKNKDEDKYYEHERKSSTSKRRSRDKWYSADELHYKPKGKSSTAKRKRRDRLDSPENSEFMVGDKRKTSKHSRKSLRHSDEERDPIEDVKRRGRWDDKVRVENYETSRGESRDSDHNGSRH